MTNQTFGFIKLLSNYMLNKVCDDFLNTKNYSIEGFSLKTVCDLYQEYSTKYSIKCPNIKEKILLLIILNDLSKYLRLNNEETLYELATVVFDNNSNSLLSLDLLSEFKTVVLKKISYMIEQNCVVKHLNAFKNFIDDEQMNIRPDADLDEAKETYTNECLYADICQIINQHIFSRNTSLLFEILKNFDFTSVENDSELELISYISTIRKRKLSNVSLNMLNEKHFSLQANLNALNESIDETARSIKRLRVDKSNISAKKTPNVANKVNDENCPPAVNDILDNYDTNLNNDAQLNNQNESMSFSFHVDQSIQSTSPTKDKHIANNSNRKSLEKSSYLQELNATKPTTSKNTKKLSSKKSLELLNYCSDDSIDEFDFEESVSKRTKSYSSSLINAKSKPNNTSSPNKTSTSANSPRKQKKTLVSDLVNINEDSDEEERPTTSKGKPSKRIDSSCDTSFEDRNEIKKTKSSKSRVVTNETDESDVDQGQKPKKQVKYWSETEAIYVIAGVEIYGKGNWAKILEAFKDKLPGRTGVNIKDKYRSVVKAKNYNHFLKQAQVVIKSQSALKERHDIDDMDDF